MADMPVKDLKTFHQLKSVHFSDILLAIALRPDNQNLLLGSSDAGVYELDMSAEKPERIKFSGEGHRSYVTGIAALPEHAVSCSYDGQLIW